jgi:Restriction endonuclease
LMASDPTGGKNTGIPYEKITKTIFEKALQRRDVDNLSVEHNAHIQGRTVKHQIDVYWRFTIAGIEYQTLVQCKDWGTNVPQSAVFTFASVLNDIPGQPRGIMIARTGFQEGAIEVAAKEKIILYTLREPSNDADWNGLVRTIRLNIEMRIPHTGSWAIDLDHEWISAEKARLGMEPDEQINVQIDPDAGRAWTCDENGQPSQTGREIMNSVFRTFRTTETPQNVRFEFPEPTYLYVSGDPRFPYLKVLALSGEIWHDAETHQHTLSADDITSYILTDVMSGAKTAINRDLEMIVAPEKAG